MTSPMVNDFTGELKFPSTLNYTLSTNAQIHVPAGITVSFGTTTMPSLM